MLHYGLPSPQLTFPPLQPFILQMLAWLCDLSFQHKGRSVDEGLALAWAPASVICPRQPLTELRGGWAWAGHEAWRRVAWGAGAMRQKQSHSCESRVNYPSSAPPSRHSQSLAMQSAFQHTISPSSKETGLLSHNCSSKWDFSTFLIQQL